MESAMQQILEALGQMEERLTATLGGRCDAIEQRSTTTVANLRGGRVGLGAGARVVVDNFSFDSFQGPTTSSVVAPMYDDDVFGSSATSAYDDEFGSSATSAYDDVFATVARFAVPSPCHDDDLLGAFGIFIPNREALNGKATAHNRFDTVPCMESESESEFLTSLAAQAPSVEEAMVTAADAGSPARLNPLPNTDEEEEEVLTITPTKCSTIDLNRGIYSVPNPILHRQHLLRDCDGNHVGVDVDILLTSEFDEGPIFDKEPCFHRNLLDSDLDSPYDWVIPVIAVASTTTATLSCPTAKSTRSPRPPRYPTYARRSAVGSSTGRSCPATSASSTSPYRRRTRRLASPPARMSSTAPALTGSRVCDHTRRRARRTRFSPLRPTGV
jgi:hypothetical protein